MLNVYEILIKTNLFEDNSYLRSYCELIENNLNRIAVQNETNRHHIIPRCYFKNDNPYKERNLEVKEFCVILNYNDHVLAHLYLSKCFKYKKHKLENVCKHMLGNYRYIKDITDEVIERYKNNSYEDVQNNYVNYKIQRYIFKLRKELERKEKENERQKEVNNDIDINIQIEVANDTEDNTTYKYKRFNTNNYYVYIISPEGVIKRITRKQLDNYITRGYEVLKEPLL